MVLLLLTGGHISQLHPTTNGPHPDRHPVPKNARRPIATRVEQPTCSEHLKMLSRAGLIHGTKIKPDLVALSMTK
jgi:hypothetical protein